DDVLSGRLPGEEQRDLVVHRATDGLTEGGIEVELNVGHKVTNLEQTCQNRVADRVDGGQIGRQPHVVLGEALLHLVGEQVLDEVLSGRLPGEEQRDLVVHRATDGLTEGGIEVELNVGHKVTHLEQTCQNRVADRVDGGQIGRQPHVVLGEALLHLVGEQVLD